MLSTFITFREHFHFSVIGDALTQDSRRTSTLLSDYTEALAAKTSGGAPVNHMQAPAEMANVVRREAFVIFFTMGLSLSLCILALFLVKKSPEDAPAAAG